MADPAASLTLSAPADPEAVDAVHDLLEQLFAGLPDLDARDRMRFELAVVEIVGNIVEHAFTLDGSPAPSGRLVEVELRGSAERLEATLQDNGKPAEIDLSRITMPDADAESGRGLALAAHALDDLTFERRGGRNRWTLLCQRQRT
jgi:serine/threonine-protein kinase RsbW